MNTAHLKRLSPALNLSTIGLRPGRAGLSVVLSATLLVAACAEAPVDAVPVQQIPTQQETRQDNGAKPRNTEPKRDDTKTRQPIEKPPTTHPVEANVSPKPRAGGRTGGQVIDLQPLDEPEAVEGGLKGGGAIDLAPTTPLSTRVRKRMNIDQLDAAIRKVSGGTGWDAANGKSEFELLAATLGKPNFTDMTTEDLEPSALFQKFLSDAAQSVCQKVANADSKQWVAEKRQLARYVKVKDTMVSNPKGVNANLAWLILRYHNRLVDPSASELEPWRFLFETATKVSGNKPAQAWRTVCVALMVHPHFYTY